MMMRPDTIDASIDRVIEQVTEAFDLLPEDPEHGHDDVHWKIVHQFLRALLQIMLSMLCSVHFPIAIIF